MLKKIFIFLLLLILTISCSVDSINNNEEKNTKAEELEKNEYPDDSSDILYSGTWHYYDRIAAVNYANAYGYWQGQPGWVANRNTEYTDYSNNHGDCTNFASQVLHAGGAAFDYSGSLLWYPDSANFIYVDGFHDYLVANTWTGPYGTSSTSASSFASLQPGDFVQLKNSSGQYYHTLVVVAVQYPQKYYDPSYIWVNYHTADTYHRKLSDISGDKRYIFISGWRD